MFIELWSRSLSKLTSPLRGSADFQRACITASFPVFLPPTHPHFLTVILLISPSLFITFKAIIFPTSFCFNTHPFFSLLSELCDVLLLSLIVFPFLSILELLKQLPFFLYHKVISYEAFIYIVFAVSIYIATELNKYIAYCTDSSKQTEKSVQ